MSVSDAPALAGIHHLKLPVTDLARSREWYRSRLGAYRAGNGELSTTVELDGETARLVLAVEVDAAGHLRQADIMLSP